MTPFSRFIDHHRDRTARILALLAVCCMALSAYFFRPQPRSLILYRPTPGPEDYYQPLAPWCLALGALLLLGALALSPRRLPHPDRVAPPLDALWPRRAWLLAAPGLLILFAVSEANGEMVSRLKWLWDMTPPVQLGLFIVGMALVVVGFGGLPRNLTPQPPLHAAERGSGENASPPDPLAAGHMGPALPSGEGETGVIALPDPLPVSGEGEIPVTTSPSPRAGRDLGRGKLRAVRGYVAAGELALLAVLTLLALIIRFWTLGNTGRILIDEGHYALGVAYFWMFPHVDLIEPMPTTASFPFIFAYGQAGMTDLLGRSFLGLRAFSAVIGGLTVPALYLLARALFDRRTALLAALILLTFPPHVHYSRLALNNIADPLFNVVALAFLARGARTQRRFHYALGGAMLGLTQYFYEGGRILFPALAFGWLALGLVLWQPRPSLRGVIIAGVVFTIVAAPVYYTLIGTDFPFFDRMDKTELDASYWSREREPNNLAARLERFRHSLMMYVNAPENTLFNYYMYYGGRHPLVLEWIVPAFLLGVVTALRFWRGPGSVVLLWMICTSAGNAMLVESAVTARYVLAFPAVALLIALGAWQAVALIWPGTARAHDANPDHLPARAGLAPPPSPLPTLWGGGEIRRLKFPLRTVGRGFRGGARREAFALALVIAMAAGQLYYYFGPHLDYYEVELRQPLHYDIEDALLRSKDFAPGTEIWIIAEGKMLPPTIAQHFANYLADGLIVRYRAPASITETELRTLPRDRHYAFYFALGDTGTVYLLARVFGPREIGYTPYDTPREKALLLYYVASPL